jgi:hypothetical protein
VPYFPQDLRPGPLGGGAAFMHFSVFAGGAGAKTLAAKPSSRAACDQGLEKWRALWEAKKRCAELNMVPATFGPLDPADKQAVITADTAGRENLKRALSPSLTSTPHRCSILSHASMSHAGVGGSSCRPSAFQEQGSPSLGGDTGRLPCSDTSHGLRSTKVY